MVHNIAKKNWNQNLCFVHPIFHFWFLVTFGKNTKILRNLCLHFAKQDGQDGKKGKKVTKLKWPKYQKPKDKNMVWMKHRRCFPTKILQPFAFDVKKISSDQMSSELFKNSYQKGADGRWNIECSWKKCEFKKSLAPLRTIKIMDCIVTYNKGLFIVQTSDPKHRPCALVIYIKIFRKPTNLVLST